MEPNQTYIVLNATLYQPPQVWYFAWFKDWSPIILAFMQLIVAGVLAILTRKLSKSTESYSDQVKKQTEIMNKNMYQDIGVLRYNRLRDEMDKLYAPLYSAVSQFKDIDENIDPNKLGMFKSLPPNSAKDRVYAEYRIITEFWDIIRRNMYLSRSTKLIQLLQEHFTLENEAKRPDQTSEEAEKNRKKYNKNIINIRNEVDSRYETLKKQIAEQEQELDIDKVFLKLKSITLTEYSKKMLGDKNQIVRSENDDPKPAR